MSLTALIPKEMASTGLIFYAVTILSFVAALHWGFAMTIKSLTPKQINRLYIWSVIPPLLAWVAMFMPPSICIALLILGFIAHLAQDFLLLKINNIDLPNWYLPLRTRLTVVAILSLLLVLPR